MTSPSWLQSLSSSIVSLLIMLFFYFLVKVYQKTHGFANIPPGPKPWPVVGNFGGFLIPSVIQRRFRPEPERSSKNAAYVLTELAKVYGNVYSIYVGSQLVVILNGYKVVKDALLSHADVFSDRPDIPAISIMTKRKGKKKKKNNTGFIPFQQDKAAWSSVKQQFLNGSTVNTNFIKLLFEFSSHDKISIKFKRKSC